MHGNSQMHNVVEFSLHLQYQMLQQRKEKKRKAFKVSFHGQLAANKYDCFCAHCRIIMLGPLFEYLYHEYFTYSFPFEIN